MHVPTNYNAYHHKSVTGRNIGTSELTCQTTAGGSRSGSLITIYVTGYVQSL